MFAKEGLFLMLGSVAIGTVLSLLGRYLSGYWEPALYVLSVLAVVFTFYFFRDPRRTPPASTPDVILAPADGKVLLVEEVEEPLYLKSRAQKVTIFLSPLNVHVNRIPANGTIEYDRYVPGKYLVAWHEKASELNERSEIGLIHDNGSKVLFKQIAGFIARRIVFHVSSGDEVTAGQRFGIVKFGSRMDVLVPLSARLNVQVGDRVVGGESILGYLAPEADRAE